jgi:hypothetical protein
MLDAAAGSPLYQWAMEWLLRIRDKRGRLVPLAANRAQREYLQRCGSRNIILKARQLGITTCIAARFFLDTITHPGTVSVQVAHDQRAAEELFRIVHRFLENLPEALLREALPTSRANVRQLIFPRLDSEYRVETAADREAGRGLTIRNLHASEVARWPDDPAETLASLRAAVPPGGQIALESTPNGAGGCFYDEWQRARETGYVQHFFPWWWEESYRVAPAEPLLLRPDELDLMRRCGLDMSQVAFRRQIAANFRGLATQEYVEDAESCFLVSGECVFDREALAVALRLAAPASASRDNGRLLIWWPPSAQARYIIGVDPAGGGTLGDYACAQVIDRHTAMQCAELHGHFTPAELAKRVAGLGREYNQALLAVERNNHGHAVLAHLAHAAYEPLFEQGGQAGWLTSALSRPLMIEEFAVILAKVPQLFSSPRLLAECRTFVRQADGRSQGAPGAHDDCVMAMAIALGVRMADAGRISRSGALQLASLPG